MDDRQHLLNRGEPMATRPNLDRLREGVGAWEASRWIEHLESLLVAHGVDPFDSVDTTTTVGAMPIDVSAVRKGAAMGLPLSGSATLLLLDHLDEVLARALRAERVADYTAAFVYGYTDRSELAAEVESFIMVDAEVMRERVGFVFGGEPPVEVEGSTEVAS